MERVRLGPTKNIFPWNDSTGMNVTNNIGTVSLSLSTLSDAFLPK